MLREVRWLWPYTHLCQPESGVGCEEEATSPLPRMESRWLVLLGQTLPCSEGRAVQDTPGISLAAQLSSLIAMTSCPGKASSGRLQIQQRLHFLVLHLWSARCSLGGSGPRGLDNQICDPPQPFFLSQGDIGISCELQNGHLIQVVNLVSLPQTRSPWPAEPPGNFANFPPSPPMNAS